MVFSVPTMPGEAMRPMLRMVASGVAAQMPWTGATAMPRRARETARKAASTATMPFMVQPVQTAFEGIGRRPAEVAATLRCRPIDAFLNVTVPLARHGIITGTLMTFAHTIGEFGVVLMIGGNIPGKTQVVSTEIFTFVEAMEYDKAHVLAGGMLVFSFIVLMTLNLLNRRHGGAVR